MKEEKKTRRATKHRRLNRFSPILKAIIVPAKWGRVLIIDGGEQKSFEKIHRTTEYAADGAKHRCRERSARSDGEWNERSPLILI